MLALIKPLSQLRHLRVEIEEIRLESLGLGIWRGALVELSGPPGSGLTSVGSTLLAAISRRGEICALIDVTDSFDPPGAVKAGVVLDNILWAKCGGNLEKAFKVADHLVQAKGFGVIWLNLNGVTAEQLKYIPRAYWYRFRNKVRETPTIFLVTGNAVSIAGSAPNQSFEFVRRQALWSGAGRFKLFRELHLMAASRKKEGSPLLSKIDFDYRDV